MTESLFFLLSLGFLRENKSDGRQRMQQTWQHILSGLENEHRSIKEAIL